MSDSCTKHHQEEEEDDDDDERFILYPKASKNTIIESQTTVVQEETEDECKPFLVDLRALDISQLNHLRSVGLLPPYTVPVEEESEDDEEEESDDEEEESDEEESYTPKMLSMADLNALTSAINADSDHDEDEESEEKVKVEKQDWESKAHKVLGIDDLNAINNDSDDDNDDKDSPRVVLLDEEIQSSKPKQTSSPPKPPSSAFDIRLLREKHKKYLLYPHLYALTPPYVSLDASRAWIIYWTLHSLDLLCELPSDRVLVNVVNTLDKFWQSIEVDLTTEEYQTLLSLDDNNKDTKQKQEQNESEKGNNTTTDNKIKVKAGGYGGGPGQIAHAATTYGAVSALSIIAANDPSSKSSQMALELLHKRRKELYAWFLSLQYFVPSSIASSLSPSFNKKGGKKMTGYRMHHDGEVDVRATYTIFTIATLLNIITLDLTNGAALYISACQTFEGGFGAEPFSEAHGGYTFCALGALALLLQSNLKQHVKEEVEQVDWSKLRKWLVGRQMSYEGGFNGRSNKLVDGCYSFWQGSALAVLDVLEYTEKHPEMSKEDACGDYGFASGIYNPSYSDTKTSRKKKKKNYGHLNFDQLLLQRYILLIAQDVNGGLRDKPSKQRDYYHSCYNLSGLSVSQHVLSCIDSDDDDDDNAIEEQDGYDGKEEEEKEEEEAWAHRVCCYGDKNVNVVAMTHPTFNIRVDRVKFILDEFHST